MKAENEFPRRSRIWLNKPAELAIRNAVDEVEKMGADVQLTEVVITLQKAFEMIADFVDKQDPPSMDGVLTEK